MPPVRFTNILALLTDSLGRPKNQYVVFAATAGKPIRYLMVNRMINKAVGWTEDVKKASRFATEKTCYEYHEAVTKYALAKFQGVPFHYEKYGVHEAILNVFTNNTINTKIIDTTVAQLGVVKISLKPKLEVLSQEPLVRKAIGKQ